MQPCPWCILQRIVYIVMGFVALTFALFQSAAPKAPKYFIVGSCLLAGLCALGLGLVGYQHFIASAQSSCIFSKAEKLVIWSQLDQVLPSVFQVTASCADAALAKLLGVPYELASGALFLALLTFILFKLRNTLSRGY